MMTTTEKKGKRRKKLAKNLRKENVEIVKMISVQIELNTHIHTIFAKEENERNLPNTKLST